MSTSANNSIDLSKVISDFQVKEFNAVLDEGPLDIKVYGSCMWPFVKNGSNVRIERVRPENIRRGDIVFAYHQDQFICHRVLHVWTNTLQTKADSFIRPDPVINNTNVIGRVGEVEGRRVRHGLLKVAMSWMMAVCYQLYRKVRYGARAH